MNLTKCFAAGLCLTAMTVSAEILKSDSFESGFSAGWDGTPAESRIDGDASLDGYMLARPLTGVTSNKLVKLDTEGGVWTNTITGGGFPNNGNKVFTDMLVKFVPSEDLPTIGSDIKLAVAVKAGTPNKLAISVINQGSGDATNVWIVTEGEIDTNTWTRLTIEMGNTNEVPYAYVKTNGVLVYFGTNITDPNILVLNGSLALNLSSIGFQGTGFIDEVVVRTDDPIATAILLTLNFAAGIDSVYVGATQKTTGQTVTSGDTLVVTASQWKEIATLTGPSTINWVDGGLGSSVATVTVAHASATNVAITAQTATNTELLTGTSFTNAPISKVAAWAIAKGVSEAALTSGMYDKYLLNIDDATDPLPALLIQSISVSGSTVTVTVQASGVDFSTINGVLKIKSYATLGGAVETHELSIGEVSGSGTATITHDIGAGQKFVKVMVE